MRVLFGVLWFLAVFIFGMLLFFPVDAVVRNQIDALERQRGVEVSWNGERWSLWRSVLTDVTVRGGANLPTLSFSSVDIKPRLSGLYVQAQAAWGGVGARVTPGTVEVDVDGLPLPKPPKIDFEDGRLKAHVEFQQANFQAHGMYAVSGRARLFFYEGPVDLSGSFQFAGSKGQIHAEVLGDRLRGHGDLEADASADGALRLDGPVRVEIQGAAHFLRLSGDVGNLSITTSQ